MKKCYLILGMIVVALYGKPQAPDSTYNKRVIPKTEIEILYSMYGQQGDHSAITGGKGTEQLTIYAPGFELTFSGSRSSFSIDAGTDVISSASTDRIDDVISSASRVDMRTHADVQYSRRSRKEEMEFSIGTGFSLESDYLSFPVRIAFAYTEPDNMRQVQIAFSAFFDDLRWGRLNPDYRRPVTLIYPAELRYKEWFDIYRRYSYNLKTGFVQVINQRLRIGIYPEVILQKGLLSTPFHRVFFTNDSLRVENLPEKRVRVPLGLKVNYFAGSRTILKGGYTFYHDDFGINAHNLELESAIKITPLLTISPFVNLYTQTGSIYFLPYAQHDSEDQFYTSDYDLSAFNSVKAGIGIRWAPFAYWSARNIFDEVQLRYAYFTRSEGLAAHMLSASFRFSREKGENAYKK
ncbi:MAG: DUF3570 domain-containing protein [Bacteroidetes bacterium]|nr:DUF3570 domain-containing protein [Bacteroidota bacterium]